MSRKQKQYGLWPSPIAPVTMAAAIKLEEVAWDSGGKTLLWLEQRGGRGVLVASTEARAARDLTDTHDVRGRVGYGGGAVCAGDGWAIYCERGGQIFRQSLDYGEPIPITPAFGHAASPALSSNGRWVLYVHHHQGRDALALVSIGGERWPQQVRRSADFYMQPIWHPNDHQIAWIEWDHPQMPWDGTRLQLATLEFAQAGCTIAELRQIAGDEQTAIFQPAFSPDGRYLAYVSDESGWNNLCIYDLDEEERRPLTQLKTDLGQPAWVQGMRTYCWANDSLSIYAVENRHGFNRMLRVDVASGRAEPVKGLEAYTSLQQPAIAGGTDRIALIASSHRVPSRVVVWQAGRALVVRRSGTERLAAEALAEPLAVSWPAQSGEVVHGLLYRPTSEDHKGSGKPPAIVAIHGGPTAQATAAYNLRAQFFASRGFAYLEVNYRGSTGYGRAYQRALQGMWGELDLEDALGGLEFLRRDEIADPQRVAIMGGSAGGLTVLRVLTAHPRRFAAGVVLYGVSNLFTLAAETHKFEQHYLDSLVGPLPEASASYRTRSPLFAADRIVDPVAIFQGSDDKVVPPSQSEAIVASLRARGVPHEYHVYEGEEHGWRRPETIQRHYEDVERFLRQWLIFS